jgi:Lar family restriction alleviation protein
MKEAADEIERLHSIIRVNGLRWSHSPEDQIKHMADRFLGWRLPENFHPDGGISFKKTFNDHMPTPMKNEPTGTNLFDAEQATAMVRYMIEGLPVAVILNPCPFCGSPATLTDQGPAHTQCVECSNPECGAEGPCHHSTADAANAWNARAHG